MLTVLILLFIDDFNFFTGEIGFINLITREHRCGTFNIKLSNFNPTSFGEALKEQNKNKINKNKKIKKELTKENLSFNKYKMPSPKNFGKKR